MSADALAQAGAAPVVGLAHFVLIWARLRQMRKASESRDRQMDRQERALEALITGMTNVIERTGGRVQQGGGCIPYGGD